MGYGSTASPGWVMGYVWDREGLPRRMYFWVGVGIGKARRRMYFWAETSPHFVDRMCTVAHCVAVHISR